MGNEVNFRGSLLSQCERRQCIPRKYLEVIRKRPADGMAPKQRSRFPALLRAFSGLERANRKTPNLMAPCLATLRDSVELCPPKVPKFGSVDGRGDDRSYPER